MRDVDEDAKTNRPPPFYGVMSKVDRYRKFAQSLFGTLAAVGAAMITMYQYIGQYTTETELRVALSAHDTEADAHASLRERLDALDVRVSHCEAEGQEQLDLWRRVIRLIAADRESDVRLKAAAASFYEDEFTQRTRAGTQASQAFLEALRVPWTDRPRLVRAH